MQYNARFKNVQMTIVHNETKKNINYNVVSSFPDHKRIITLEVHTDSEPKIIELLSLELFTKSFVKRVLDVNNDWEYCYCLGGFYTLLLTVDYEKELQEIINKKLEYLQKSVLMDIEEELYLLMEKNQEVLALEEWEF